MTARARTLRKGATPAERILWRLLSNHRPRFTRQLVVDNHILDLACRTAQLAVELDGSQHLDETAYDAHRTALLEQQGWHVIRFWNNEVLANPQAIADAIAAAAATRLRRNST